MLKKFIERPVLSLVISLFITLLGILALSKLPVTQYPDIAPPAVSVTTKYTGANAEVAAKAVVTPLERAINGVPGMAYMTSVSGNDGTSIIQVYFKVGTDPDLAAVNVQNRVATVLDELPEEVIKAGVSTEKEVNSMLMYLNLISNDSTLDEKFIYNFADINVLAELKRIDGVGFADIMGQREYAMRVWLKPSRMDAYEISAEEIIQALREQNVEAAPGKVGESSGRHAQSLQYVLRYTGKLTQKEQYENLVIRVSENGEMLRLKDVAEIEFGSLDYDVLSKENGRPSAAIILKQRPGSNASEVIATIKERLEYLKSTTFPPGMDYTISYDVSRFLDASIHEVIKTLIEAFLLVALVVFIFLQDWRSTLIPVLAVPVSLIGTFAFMQMFGFSINLLTLFALVLAIGIVVDNAIVVVEAVHAKMEENHMDAKTATLQAMNEIGGAIIAITLVMSAVFIPVAFLDGPVGVFYRQFSITMAIAIVISGVNALTLTPALCALFLKNPHDTPKVNNWLTRFFDAFNTYYNSIALKYRRLLSVIANRRTVTIGALLLFCFATWGSGSLLPTGFIPTEDQGTIYVNVTTPVGATLERTEKVMNEIDLVSETIPEIESVSTLAGFSMMTDGSGASFGMSTISLKPWKDRKHNADEIITMLREKTKHIQDADIQFFPPPAVPGFGNASGFELRLLDKTGSGSLQQTNQVTQQFMEAVKKRKEIKNIFTSFNPNFPQYLIHIDQDVAAKKGVSVDNAMSNLQILMGSYYATNFIRFGQMYKVMLQSDPKFRAQPEDILKLRVKNKQGEMVPYANFSRIERVYGPEQLTRYNMYLSAMLNGEAAEGYSSGDAIKAIEEVAKETLSKGFSYEWSGMTREEILSGNQVIYIFVICLLFVYLLLSAQYESFLLPLPVILSLPVGIFGSLFLLYILGLENNIYAQVAMVMLIGLLGKNAILIIEFAILKQKEGRTVLQAAVEGAVARLRPILMTSFAFIAGLIPLLMATGAGAIGNRTIGAAAAGGMLFGTVFGLVLIPGLYVLFAGLKNRKKENKDSIISIKQMKEIARLSVILLTMAFLSSCKTNKNAGNHVRKEIPKTYTVSSDTASLKLDSWRSFFADPYLSSLIDSALVRNFDLNIAKQRIEASRAGIRFTRGIRLPELDLAISSGQRKFGSYTMDGVGNYDTRFSPNLDEKRQLPDPIPDYFVGIHSTWEIDLWGKLKDKKKAALARFISSQHGKDLIQTSLIAEIATAYFELQALDKEADILEDNINLQQSALDVIISQKEAGKSNQLGVELVLAQLLNSKAVLAEVQQKRIEYESQLNFLSGKYPGVVQREMRTDNPALLTALTAGIPSDLLVNRPDIRQAEMDLMASHADLSAARKAFYPTFNISAFLGAQSFNALLLAEMPASMAYNILGGLTAPLMNRRKLKAELMTVKAEQKQAYINYEKKVVGAFMEVYNALNNIKNNKLMLDLKNEEVTILKQSALTAAELFKANRANYLEVILSQKNALQSQLELVNFEKRQNISMISLYRSLGGGAR
ncbi:MAG: efflux RND transporter permease subunit [Bacteroidia bacterium]|nr:efflux RND transporter permease subunit [Bacteroidia bacterium]